MFTFVSQFVAGAKQELTLGAKASSRRSPGEWRQNINITRTLAKYQFHDDVLEQQNESSQSRLSGMRSVEVWFQAFLSILPYERQ